MDEGKRKLRRTFSFKKKENAITSSDSAEEPTSPLSPRKAASPSSDAPARRRLGFGLKKKKGEEDGSLSKKEKKKSKKDKKKGAADLPAGDASGDDDSEDRDRKEKRVSKKSIDRPKKSTQRLKNSLSSSAYPAGSVPADCPVLALDKRMLAFLLSFLSGDDLLSARLVSKGWSAVIAEQSQFVWKSACMNLWTSQLRDYATIRPSLLSAAHPEGRHGRATDYVLSVLHSSVSADWRRLYFLSTRGIPLDLSTQPFVTTCTGSRPASSSSSSSSSASSSSSPSSSSSSAAFVFSPLQLLLRGDLRVFEPPENTVENDGNAECATDGARGRGGDEDQAQYDESFLDVGPYAHGSGPLDRYEEAIGGLLVPSSGPGPASDRRAKIIWRAQVLPGFRWTVLAFPNAARPRQYFIANTASLLRDGKVITQRGGREMSAFLATLFSVAAEQGVVVLPSFIRLLSIAFGVPQVIPQPLWSDCAPHRVASPEWAFVFFHRPGAVTEKTVTIYTLKNRLREEEEERHLKRGTMAFYQTLSSGLSPVPSGTLADEALEELEEAKGEDEPVQGRGRSGTQLFYEALAGGAVGGSGQPEEEDDEQLKNEAKQVEPVEQKNERAQPPPPRKTETGEAVMLRTCVFRDSKGSLCFLRSHTTSAPPTTNAKGENAVGSKPVVWITDDLALLRALEAQGSTPYPAL